MIKMKHGFWHKVEIFITKPNDFFKGVKNEGMSNALLAYILVSAVMTLIAALFHMVFTLIITYGQGEIANGLLFTLAYYIAMFAIGLAVTFIYSLMMHILVKIWKGHGTFKETYKAYTYAILPYAILSIIPFIGVFSLIWTGVLMIIGIFELHKISYGKSAGVCLIPAAVVSSIVTVGFIVIIIVALIAI